MDTDICDFNTITGKYIYFKLWGQAIEDAMVLLTMLCGFVVLCVEVVKQKYYKRD